MQHEDFKEDLRRFRLKSRTWAGERSKRDMYCRLKNLWERHLADILPALSPTWHPILFLFFYGLFFPKLAVAMD